MNTSNVKNMLIKSYLISNILYFLYRIHKGFFIVFSYIRPVVEFPNSKNLSLPISVLIKEKSKLWIGNNVRIGEHSIIGASGSVIIYDNVVISNSVIIESAGLDFKKNQPYPHKFRKVIIEKGAWIGAGSIILPGVIIGENAIVGAGSVVRSNVEKGQLYVG